MYCTNLLACTRIQSYLALTSILYHELTDNDNAFCAKFIGDDMQIKQKNTPIISSCKILTCYWKFAYLIDINNEFTRFQWQKSQVDSDIIMQLL